MLVTITIFVLVFISETHANQVCKSTGNCKAICNETKLDISKVLDLPVDVLDKSGGNKHNEETVFTYNPCEGNLCEKNQGTESAVCRNNGTNPVNCGHINEAQWVLHSTNPYRYTVTYEGGTDGKESIVKFIEDISVNNVNFSYTGEQPNGTFNFEIIGKCVNPKNCQPTNSSGSIVGGIGFAIIFIVIICAGLYFGIGALVMHLRGAKGLELIPHFQFWKDLPFLVRDGCLWSIHPCIHRCRNEQETAYAELM